MNKKWKKIIILAILAPLLFVALGISTLALLAHKAARWDEITTGEKYGFKISTTKSDVYDFIIYHSNEYDSMWCFNCTNAINNKIKFEEKNKQEIMRLDQWDLHPKSPFWIGVDNLTLSFTDDRLSKIFRHRDICEVP
jgi:uncharacterized protein YpmS